MGSVDREKIAKKRNLHPRWQLFPQVMGSKITIKTLRI